MKTRLIPPHRAAIAALVGLAVSCAWAQQPERAAPQGPAATPGQAVWTPSADAPAGALAHTLEGQRHDRAIERAQKGNIDVVFFGNTGTEMWSWPDRGRSVWDRTLAPLQAANFGSQGTSPKSLLWRMQNGELDGYRAKLVVLQVFGPGDNGIAGGARLPDFLESFTTVLAEIRARQPQAKILISASVPRGRLGREPWRALAKENAAAVAGLVDNVNVFYVDFGERFFLPDGSFGSEMWGGKAGVGMQPRAFEVWAEELQPWLDRFVR